MRHRNRFSPWLLSTLTLGACAGGQTYDDGSDPVRQHGESSHTAADASVPPNAEDASSIPQAEPDSSTHASASHTVAPPPASSTSNTADPNNDEDAGNVDGGSPDIQQCIAEWNSISQIYDASLEDVDYRCLEDADCVVFDETPSCLYSCGASAFNVSSAASVLDSIDAINANQCSDYLGSGCTPIATPCPAQPGTPRAYCEAGMCALAFIEPDQVDPIDACPFPSAEITPPWAGTWSGSLTLSQDASGEHKETSIDVTLEFDAYGMPTNALLGVGYAGKWSVYAAGGSDNLNLSPLYETHGQGEAYAYSRTEADGPANPLIFESSCASLQPRALNWTYNVALAWADLVDYSLYAYVGENAPHLTFQATERYTLSEDRQALDVDASSFEPSETGAHSFAMRGQLTRD